MQAAEVYAVPVVTQKHALSNNEKKPKATTKPWFGRLLRHPARKRSSVGIHIY